MRIAGPLAVVEGCGDRAAQPGVALIRGQLDVDIPWRMIGPDQRLEDLCSMGFGAAIVSTLTAHTAGDDARGGTSADQGLYGGERVRFLSQGVDPPFDQPGTGFERLRRPAKRRVQLISPVHRYGSCEKRHTSPIVRACPGSQPGRG